MTISFRSFMYRDIASRVSLLSSFCGLYAPPPPPLLEGTKLLLLLLLLLLAAAIRAPPPIIGIRALLAGAGLLLFILLF